MKPSLQPDSGKVIKQKSLCRGCLNNYQGHSSDESGVYCEHCGTRNFYKGEIMNQDLLEAAKPLIKYLSENHHPHTICVVDASSAEVYEGQIVVNTKEFLHD